MQVLFLVSIIIWHTETQYNGFLLLAGRQKRHLVCKTPESTSSHSKIIFEDLCSKLVLVRKFCSMVQRSTERTAAPHYVNYKSSPVSIQTQSLALATMIGCLPTQAIAFEWKPGLDTDTHTGTSTLKSRLYSLDGRRCESSKMEIIASNSIGI